MSNAAPLLKLALFCSGNGSDPHSYRPNADESQWWGRRDALVRCVSSCMIATSNPIDLYLLFTDDSSVLHMHIGNSDNNGDKPSPFVPTERNLIKLWKQAAQSPQHWIRGRPGGRVSCRLECLRQSSSSSSSSSIDISKRERIERLHATCSMEFLRDQGLNCSVEVLLRKLNRSRLDAVEQLWFTTTTTTSTTKKRKRTSDHPMKHYILRKMLQPDSASVTKVIAATLHESSDNELPCWDEDDDISTTSSAATLEPNSNIQLCLFLGAVRDMTPTEHSWLVTPSARPTTATTLRIRLGPVPEFSSKILSVVVFHHSQNRLLPAILRLQRAATAVQQGPRIPGSMSPTSSAATDNDQPVAFHFCCFFPELETISTNLADRSPAVWCLVRCTVAALWRSRIVAARRYSTTKMTVVLGASDFTYATATTDTMLRTMAEKHQAAPSEYQVLQAWKGLLPPPSKTPLRQLLLLDSKTTHVIDYTSPFMTTSNAIHKFYSKQRCSPNATTKPPQQKTVVVLLDPCGSCNAAVTLASQARAQNHISVVNGQQIVNTQAMSDPRSAAFTSITLLQHLADQNRLWDLLH